MASNLIRHYPSISKDEFKAACLSLEQRSQRVIDDPSWMGVRRVEKGDESALRVRKELSIALEEPYDDAPNASEADDDNDHEAFERFSSLHPVSVDFWITLSPIYEVPVLWFQILDLPSTALQGFEAVYEYLVPNSHRSQLKAVGNIGSISMALNPMNDIPFFFIHPCNTPTALLELGQGKKRSYEEYLLLWLGLIGPSVSLYVPTSMLELGCTANLKS